MKFIITENKLENVIFNYLDGIIDYVNYYGDRWFHLKGTLDMIGKYDVTSEKLSISSFGTVEIMDTFGFELDEAEFIFKNYLISKLEGAKINSVNRTPYKIRLPEYIIDNFREHFKIKKQDED